MGPYAKNRRLVSFRGEEELVRMKSKCNRGGPLLAASSLIAQSSQNGPLEELRGRRVGAGKQTVTH